MDWNELEAAFAEVVGENSSSVSILRAGMTLAPQTVRIARSGTVGMGVTRSDDGLIETSQGVVIVGATTLDIQREDRFVLSGNHYEVFDVRPNRRVVTVAEGRVIQ